MGTSMTSTVREQEYQLARAFFTNPPVNDGSFDDLEPVTEPLSSEARGYRLAAFVILVAGFVGIGSYAYYANVIMPRPVELVSATGVGFQG